MLHYENSQNFVNGFCAKMSHNFLKSPVLEVKYRIKKIGALE